MQKLSGSLCAVPVPLHCLKVAFFIFFVGGKYNTISVILNKNDPVQATDFQCCIRVPESESSLLYRTLWT